MTAEEGGGEVQDHRLSQCSGLASPPRAASVPISNPGGTPQPPRPPRAQGHKTPPPPDALQTWTLRFPRSETDVRRPGARGGAGHPPAGVEGSGFSAVPQPLPHGGSRDSLLPPLLPSPRLDPEPPRFSPGPRRPELPCPLYPGPRPDPPSPYPQLPAPFTPDPSTPTSFHPSPDLEPPLPPPIRGSPRARRRGSQAAARTHPRPAAGLSAPGPVEAAGKAAPGRAWGEPGDFGLGGPEGAPRSPRGSQGGQRGGAGQAGVLGPRANARRRGP